MPLFGPGIAQLSRDGNRRCACKSLLWFVEGEGYCNAVANLGRFCKAPQSLRLQEKFSKWCQGHSHCPLLFKPNCCTQCEVYSEVHVMKTSAMHADSALLTKLRLQRLQEIQKAAPRSFGSGAVTTLTEAQAMVIPSLPPLFQYCHTLLEGMIRMSVRLQLKIWAENLSHRH